MNRFIENVSIFVIMSLALYGAAELGYRSCERKTKTNK